MFLENKQKFNIVSSFFYLVFESLTFSSRKKIFSYFKDVKGLKALEIGCGTGSNSLILAQRQAEVIGIDLSKSQIYFAHKRTKKYKNLKLKFIQANGVSLDFPANNFDLVFCFYSLHELGTLQILKQVLKEIKRVLKPNGKLVVLDYNKTDNILAEMILKLIFLLEPKETLKNIFNQNVNDFAKEYHFKALKEKLYWLDSLKLWIFNNEKN